MEFENKYVDELIELRKEARENKDWKLSDEIRKYLDEKLVFVFDTKDKEGKQFQEVWYLPESYFDNKDKYPETEKMTKRQYVEYRIKEEIRIEKNVDSWIYSMQSSK